MYLLLLVSTQLQVPFPVVELCPYICQVMPIKFDFVCSFYILLSYVPKLANGNFFCFYALTLDSLGLMFWDFFIIFMSSIHRPSSNLVNIPFMVPALCPLLTLARSEDIHVHVLLTHSSIFRSPICNMSSTVFDTEQPHILKLSQLTF